ncbi:M1 family metallopeptidase [Thermoflexus sp.]|uniref:M1 family metallopeptidase n=1 Tax=Thermoflexus sp. TaxID=1969742 RepID=UPI0017CC4C63|nr:M1 family aminopeptidase [Thermoflexus sp.]
MSRWAWAAILIAIAGAGCGIGFALGALAVPELARRMGTAYRAPTVPAAPIATPILPAATVPLRPSPSPEEALVPTATPLPTYTPTPPRTRMAPPPAFPETPEALPLEVPDPPSEPEWLVGLSPSARAAGVDRRPVYRIGGVLEPQSGRLRGRLILTFPYERGAPLRALCFRAWANAPASGGSRLEVGIIRQGGRPVSPNWSLDRTAFTVTLPSPLQPGETVELEMPFTVTIGARAGGYGLMQKTGDGRLVLYYGYPELARIQEGRCVLDPPWENGDLHQAEAAHFALRLRLPEGMALAASGVTVRESAGPGGWQTVEIVAPYTRNFVMVAGEMRRISVERDGIRVNGFYRNAPAAEARRALEDAADALERFGRAFGDYPLAELDVVEVPLRGGAAGVEASGLVMIGEDLYGMGDLNGLFGGLSPGGGTLDLLGFVVAHEVAHQWWYGMVGNDAHREPWLDEGLTNWSAVFWVEQAHGPEAARMTWDLLVLFPYRFRLMEGDLPLNMPAERYSPWDYAAIVYGKGAWMMEVLRREMGEERFFAFLRRYLQRHRWSWATGDSWRETLAEFMGKERAEAFYQRWVTGAGVTEKDLPPSETLDPLLRDPTMAALLRSLLELLMQAQP